MTCSDCKDFWYETSDKKECKGIKDHTLNLLFKCSHEYSNYVTHSTYQLK